jgi:hypothetical protein
MKSLPMVKGAKLSDCRTYRYGLWREWDGDGKCCVFIGFNPSTADENEDDPTIRRCIQFAKDWGYGRLVMLNLFAYRSTDPNALSRVDNPIGDENDQMLLSVCSNADIVVAAWGNHGALKARDKEVLKLLDGQTELQCFKITNKGQPIHPLYQAKIAKLINYSV